MTTNFPHQKPSPCVLYDQDTSTEALLPSSSSRNLAHRTTHAAIRAYSFGLGIVVGILVPLAILTVSAFLLLSDNSFCRQVLVSTIPSIVVPILILNGMQGLVRLALVYQLPTDPQSHKNDDKIAQQLRAGEIEDVMEILETRFLLGTAIGFLLAWALEEFALGTKADMYFWVAIGALTHLGSASAVYFVKNVRESNKIEEDSVMMIV